MLKKQMFLFGSKTMYNIVVFHDYHVYMFIKNLNENF